MKTGRCRHPHWPRWIKCAVYASLTFAPMVCTSRGQTRQIDFENIPPVYTRVESFGRLLPGVSLDGSGQWIADNLNSWYFENMYGRAISAFPDGSSALSINFDQPVRDVGMDLGSSWIGGALSFSITGYRDIQALFSDTFTTHVVSGGADEVRAQTFGVVDRLAVVRAAGDAHPILDNLSFVVVPEPRAVIFILAVLVLGVFRMILRQAAAKVK